MHNSALRFIDCLVYSGCRVLIYQASQGVMQPRNHFKVSAFVEKTGAFMISAWDCFHFATLELVRSTPIKQRLICAYRQYLSVMPEDQLPSDIRESFGKVMHWLRGVQPLRGEDAVSASVRKMSNQEADECTALIVEMFGRISRAQSSAGRSNNSLIKLHSVDSDSEFDAPALIANN